MRSALLCIVWIQPDFEIIDYPSYTNPVSPFLHPSLLHVHPSPTYNQGL